MKADVTIIIYKRPKNKAGPRYHRNFVIQVIQIIIKILILSFWQKFFENANLDKKLDDFSGFWYFLYVWNDMLYSK